MDLFNRKKIESIQNELIAVKKELAVTSSYHPYTRLMGVPFDGEKTPGEMGAAKDYTLIYQYLRVRSWQAFLESEIAQIVINKFILWVVGTGLKVQPEPVKLVLEQEGIKLSPDFIKKAESRFNLWTFSRFSDASKMTPIDMLVGEIEKNAIVGGDCLIIFRVDKGYVDVQIIDGSSVVSPYMQDNYFKEAKDRGNRIEYGVELSQSNEHIAYYVYGADNKMYRVERIGKKSGRLMAYMHYGNKYRVGNVRGLPLLSSVLETLKKLDRYKEATVGSAEERQKIAYSVEHNANSTGENIFLTKLAQSEALGMGEATESKSVTEYEAASTKIATTTQKQAFNMPIGATLKLLESKNELYFKDFYTTNIQLVCASVGIPYEVAMSMYNSNYSASRAAIKDWEHSMKTARERFAFQFYQNFYNLWLEMEILTGKIQADGYMKAVTEGNLMAIEAYRNARWLGVNVPHIDPLKEVMAERLKLGDDTTPITDYDSTTETLGSGPFIDIMEKVKQQKLLIPKPEPDPNVAPAKKNGEAKKAFYEQIIKEWQET
jgi:hypothetical protein